MDCRECGTENTAGHQFCSSCGERLSDACRVCGTEPAPGARFCHNCGSPLGADDHGPDEDAPPIERRLVTVLFCDLVGFTAASERRDAEEMRNLLSRYFETARGIIDRFGGLVEKYIGDAVMAVWGARIANEDDAERAVRAGLELRDAVAKLAAEDGEPGLQVRIGVLTGEAVVGSGGNESTGMVVGDLVNTAARLQSVAHPGSVFVGRSTYLAAQRAVAFEPAGLHEVKGKEAPLAAYEALRVVAARRGRERVAGLDPPFVGRHDELQLLKDLAAGVERDQRARLVTVIGDVGIGKTRLAWELRKYLDGLAAPVQWHQGHSTPYGSQGVVHRAISDLIRSVIGVDDETPPEEVAAAVDAAMDAAVEMAMDQRSAHVDEQLRMRPWLEALLGLAPAPEGDRADLDGAIRNFLRYVAAQGATALVFEDLQWAGEGLLTLVEQLPRWMPDAPLLVIALARPELLRSRSHWGTGSRAVTIRLDPMTDHEMRALVTGMLGEVDDGFAAALTARAAGIPLYAVELVRSLMAQGLIETDDGHSRAAVDLRDVAIPETLQSLVGSRIDRLGRTEGSLLQDAAILGPQFTLDGLAAISAKPADEITPSLARLAAAELVEPLRHGSSPEHTAYAFLQELVREVALGRMRRDLRRSRHLAAAEYHADMDSPDAAAVAADHYLSALAFEPDVDAADEIRSRAAEVLTASLERAADLYAHEEVLTLGTRLLDLGLDPSQQAAINEELTTAAGSIDRYEDAERYALAALTVYRDRGGGVDSRRVIGVLAENYMAMSQPERAVEILHEALEPHDDLAAEPGLAALGAIMAKVMLMRLDLPAALHTADITLAASERLGLLPVTVDALVTKASSFGIMGRQIESRLLFEGALAIAERHDLTSVAMRAYINMAASSPGLDVADEATQRALQLGRRTGNLPFLSFALTNRASTLLAALDHDGFAELVADPQWAVPAAPTRLQMLLLEAYAAGLRGNAAAAQRLLQAIEDERGDREIPSLKPGLAIAASLAGDRSALPGLIAGRAGTPLDDRVDDNVLRAAFIAASPEELARLLEGASPAVLESADSLAGVAARMLAARDGDAASLAQVEARLGTFRATQRRIDEVVSTIGLSRLLSAGTPAQVRITRQAQQRIERYGVPGLLPLLDPDTHE